MPRIKSTEIVLRDQEIVAAARRNIPRRDIAEKYGISQARVSQIITQNLDPKYPDEDLRAWLLEGYFGDLGRLQEIKEGPGRAVTSGKGEHVIDGATGEYAYDTSPVTDAIRTAAQVRKNIATLMGNEKPAPKSLEGGPEWEQAVTLFRNQEMALREKDRRIADLEARLAALEGSHPADVVG